MEKYGQKMFDEKEHEIYNRQVQEEQLREDQGQNYNSSKKKPDIDPNLSYEERKKIRDLKIPIRENLKFKSIAQYKALQDGDTFQFDMIENQLIKKPSLKGLALSSRSIK